MARDARGEDGGTPASTAGAGGSRRPLVGRARERARLDAALARARAGNGSCVLIAGEPGIGKTTLVQSLADAMPAGRVLWGRCHESSGAPAYWPWVQMLRSHVAALSAADLAHQVGGGGADLARILPVLRTRLPDLGEPAGGDPDESRFLLFDALSGLLARAAASEPLLLVIEDLHWADRDSLLLLLHVASELRGTRLLVVGTHREAEMRTDPSGIRVLGDLARVCERITLGGLDEQDVGALVRALAGREAPPPLVASLHRVTDGNPFFVAEVVELLRAEGELDADVAGGVAAGRVRIPDTVREAILRRLDPLAAETQRLLGVAAVLGREPDVAVLAAVAGRSVEQVLSDLEPALDLGLVAAAGERAGRYRFAHAVLSHTLEAELPPAERADLHLRAGEALERLHALDLRPLLGEIAQHFFHAASAGGRERAIDYALRAGRRALDALGFAEAREHFARAVAAQRAGGGEPRRLVELLFWLGVAQRRTGAETDARETLLEVARLARDLGDAGALARAALNVAAARAETGIADTVLIALLEEVLATLDERDTPLRAHVMGTLARCLYFTAERERRETLSVDALAIARRSGDASALAATLEQRHFVLWRAGTTRERLALATEMVQVAEQAGDREAECDARTWRLLDLVELGELTEAHGELARLALAADHLRSPRHRWQSTVIRAALALFAGRVDEAETLAVQAMGLRQASTSNNMRQFFAVQMFHIRRAQGRHAEVLASMADPSGRAATLPVWRCGIAQLKAELGEIDAARAELDALAADGFAAIPDDANSLSALAALVETARMTGAADHARALHERLLPHAGELLVTGLTTVILGPAQRYLGVAAAAAGDLDRAVEHFEAAIAHCTALGAALDLARAREGLARTLERRGAPGDRARARTLAGAAEPTPGAHDGTLAAAPQRDATPARSGVCRREGDFWTLSCGGEIVRLKSTKGVEYLATLLARPGREVHALDLERGEHADPAASARAGDAGEALDGAARHAYRRRLEQIADDLQAARDAGDDARATTLAGEQRALERELKRAVGLGGRARRVASDAERARVNVTRAIGGVLKKITQASPELGRHLERSVSTGTFCSYDPPADGAIRWQS